MSKKATLTPRQVQILRLSANGATDKAIANSLGVSINTISNHFCNILTVLRAKSRTHAVFLTKQRLKKPTEFA